MTNICKHCITAIATLLISFTSIKAYNYTLSDFVLPASRPAGIASMRPSAIGDMFYSLDDNGTCITLTSLTDPTKTCIIIDNQSLEGDVAGTWEGYKPSADGKTFLMWTNSEPIYRYSFRADYYVVDVESQRAKRVSDCGGEEIATLSPDGRKVAYVKENNVYIKLLDSDETIKVTADGLKNHIIYGVPDWVYQEEFGLLNSLRWSQSSDELSFIRWDESEVPMCSIELYEGACKPNAKYSSHPGRFDYKYPAAGETNSTVSVWSYNLNSRHLTTINTPTIDTDYIPNIDYNGRQLIINVLNRDQNDFHIFAVQDNGGLKQLYHENSDVWIDNDVVTGVKFYGDFFVVMSNRDGYNHLYKYSAIDGSLERQITNGQQEVLQYYGYDTNSHRYYAQATNGAINRVVISIDEQGNITMLSPAEGVSTATFSGDFNYFILGHSDALTPTRYRVMATKGASVVRDLQLNEQYTAKYTDSEIPHKEFFTFETEGYTLNGYLIKPKDFDPNKKYPCIMSQYNGPGSQEVLNRWNMDWEYYFAMQGYVIACVDGRGTGGRGKDFMKTVYLNLGKHETEDQVAAARYMASLPWIDENKIGIYGWSYGGFEALMCLSADDAPYAAGVSIAPVTSWKFYDSIYTERYMLTPEQNSEGYDNAPLNKIENLKGDLLLMFGSADDNVRIVNSMQYIARLNELNHHFDMLVFPNMNHSINGCDARLVVYSKMLEFFNSKLK